MACFHPYDVRSAAHAAGTVEQVAQDVEAQRARACDIIAAATDMPMGRVEEALRTGCTLDARDAETYGLVAQITERGEL